MTQRTPSSTVAKRHPHSIHMPRSRTVFLSHRSRLQVRVRVAPVGEPLAAFYCHCEACRRASGAPVSMGVSLLAEHVTVTQVCSPSLPMGKTSGP